MSPLSSEVLTSFKGYFRDIRRIRSYLVKEPFEVVNYRPSCIENVSLCNQIYLIDLWSIIVDTLSEPYQKVYRCDIVTSEIGVRHLLFSEYNAYNDEGFINLLKKKKAAWNVFLDDLESKLRVELFNQIEVDLKDHYTQTDLSASQWLVASSK